MFRILLITFFCSGLSAQDLGGLLGGLSKQSERNAKVTGVRLRCVPEDCRVRPMETLVVQVMVDGEVPVRDGEPRKGRLRRAPGAMKVVEAGGGWLSKQFKFQGEDPGGYLDSGGGFFRGVFERATSDFAVQDAFLYSAPARPGVYTLENDTEGAKGQVKITVDASASSTRKPEEFNFGPEDRSREPYRALAEYWAPMLAQETWWQPKSDYPTRFDFDNDLVGDNNWDNLDKGTSQAYVYYAVMETGTHWFLIYNIFHPRDYSDKCIAGSCHENDNEGLILTVHKNGSEFGKLLAMETLAHNNIYSYINDSSIYSGAHNVDGSIEFFENRNPIVFIESGGHGIYGSSTPNHSRYNASRDDFTGGTGVTFVYKGVAERPKHANDRKVGYELLPILTHWWARAENDQNQRMFDDFGPYQPLGGRPGIKLARVGRTFLGRKEAANKAKPFWGWHDSKTLKENVLAAGQWGLDPAYAVSRNLRFPASMNFSLDYVYHPYLGIGGETQDAAPPAVTVSAGTPLIGAPGAVAHSQSVPSATPAANEGSLEVEASVDASVVFHIFDQHASAEVLSGQSVRETKVKATGPVATGAGISYSVEKISGRGAVQLIEQPSANNGNVVKVRVDDTRGGADLYRFRLKWKRN
jgi:hypothetical protein